MQVQRIAPIIDVDKAGNVHWENASLQYDPALFYGGKKITNEVFNDLFVKQTSHGNYTSDTLKQFLTDLLPAVIFRQVQNRFKFTEHYTRLFNSTDWKGPDSNGYYYIDIPATEHGIYVADDENMQATVRVEMYALDSNGNFYNIKQFDIDNDNGVRLYTDDTSLIGYAIIALSNKAYAVVNQGKIDVSQIEGLSPVALSGNYSDLNGIPDEDVTTLANDIVGLKNGTTIAGKAKVAEDVEHILTTTKFAGIPFTDIFETGSSYVKNTTHATSADSATKADSATNATNAINATNLTIAPAFGTLDNSITVKAGGKTSSAFTVPYATKAGTATNYTADGGIGLKIKDIEGRLDKLGFKEATITNVNSTYIKEVIAFTQGKVVAVQVELTGNVINTTMDNYGDAILVAKLSDIDLSFMDDDRYLICDIAFISSESHSNDVNAYYLEKNGDIKLYPGYTQSAAYKNLKGGIIGLTTVEGDKFVANMIIKA